MSKEKTALREDVKTGLDPELREPPLYRVILHNDDYTTMDFVIMILRSVFEKSKEDATRIMLNVHHRGRGIAGVYTREIGETKIAIVHGMARDNQFPLKCSLEKMTP